MTTPGPAPNVPLTSGASSASSTAPTEKNQLIPRIASHTPRPPAAVFRIAQVPRAMFQSIASPPGAVAGARGTARLARNPSIATPSATRPGLPRRNQAAGQLARQDGQKGARLDQPGAAHDLVVAQMLRQDRVV